MNTVGKSAGGMKEICKNELPPRPPCGTTRNCKNEPMRFAAADAPAGRNHGG